MDPVFNKTQSELLKTVFGNDKSFKLNNRRNDQSISKYQNIKDIKKKIQGGTNKIEVNRGCNDQGCNNRVVMIKFVVIKVVLIKKVGLISSNDAIYNEIIENKINNERLKNEIIAIRMKQVA